MLAIVVAELVADICGEKVACSKVVAIITITVVVGLGPTARGQIGLPTRPGNTL